MFDKFENIKNLAAVMGQAKDLKQKIEKLQNELASKTVEADAGAGAVRVVANGKLEIISVRINRLLLASLVGDGSDADQPMVEDLIAAATNAALRKSRQLIQSEITRLTGGLNVPGLDKLLGG